MHTTKDLELRALTVSRFEAWEAFVLIYHIDFSLEVFPVLVFYIPNALSLAQALLIFSCLLSLKSTYLQILQITIRSIHSLLNNLQQPLLAYSIEPKLFR